MERNRRFSLALDYLYKKGKVADQRELALKTGITETSISRILNNKVKEPSNATIRKLNAAFGEIFNVAFFRGEDVAMLMADKKEVVEPKTDPTDNIIELYGSLVKDIESLRRELKEEIATIHDLRIELATTLHYLRGQYTLPTQPTNLTNEPEIQRLK